MKLLTLLLLIALTGSYSFAQSQVPSKAAQENSQNVTPGVTNSLSNGVNLEMNSPSVMDTTIQIKKMESRESKKTNSPLEEEQNSEAVSSSSLYKANSANFGSVYQESTHNKVSRSATPVQQKQMNSSLGYMNTLAPTAFETNLFNYVNSRYDSDSASYLLQAAKINPSNVLLRKQLSAYYLVEEKPQLADSITQTLYADGTYCTGMNTYATALSYSVPATNTIVVHGIDDLLPLAQVQTEGNKTFEIVSLELLQSKDYRKSLEKLGYKIPASKIVDTAFLVDFVQLNPNKNIQLSMTLPKEYLANFMPNLYPMGLTFVLKQSPDLNKFNAELWENEWNKEALMNGTGDWSDNLTKNYLPALYTLQKYYIGEGKEEEVLKIQQVIDAISTRNGIKPKGGKTYSGKKGG